MKLDFAHGYCHALSCALLDLAPAGEVLGLFLGPGDDCIHSIFRVPQTQIYLDAGGAASGPHALFLKARPYVWPGEDGFSWRPLTEEQVWRFVPGGWAGDKRRLIATAKRLARTLLAKT